MSTTNYAVAPGAYLEEWINENGHSQQHVADQLSVSRKLVNAIINGRAPVTPETALRLERVVGIPADAWLRYEALYRADRARLADEEDLAVYATEIDPSAATYLRRIGATKATKAQPGMLVSDFLAFHRCGTWQSYRQLHELAAQGEYALAALKEAASVKIDSTLLTTWLRAGEQSREFERGRLYDYKANELQQSLPRLRARAAVPDARMLNDLAAMLREVGVVFMVVEPPQRFPLHGMTRWIERRVPVVQQTGRWGTDGFVIWTFFHELGHVLNDPRGEMHFEYSTDKKRNTAAERGANKFAMDLLFGEAGMAPFGGLTKDDEIRAAAKDVGVAPGVAVLQMHRRRFLPYNYGGRLRVDLSGTYEESI